MFMQLLLSTAGVIQSPNLSLCLTSSSWGPVPSSNEQRFLLRSTTQDWKPCYQPFCHSCDLQEVGQWVADPRRLAVRADAQTAPPHRIPCMRNKPSDTRACMRFHPIPSKGTYSPLEALAPCCGPGHGQTLDKCVDNLEYFATVPSCPFPHQSYAPVVSRSLGQFVLLRKFSVREFGGISLEFRVSLLWKLRSIRHRRILAQPTEISQISE